MASGAAPTLPNYAGPNGSRSVDQLLGKDDFVLADITSGVYVGPGGTKNGSQAAVGVWDFRPYRSVILTAVVTGMTGTTPLINLTLHGRHDLTPGNFTDEGQSKTQQFASGAAQLFLVDTFPVGSSNTGVSFVNGAPITLGYWMPFAQLSIDPSGVISALTSLTIYMYGIRGS